MKPYPPQFTNHEAREEHEDRHKNTLRIPAVSRIYLKRRTGKITPFSKEMKYILPFLLLLFTSCSTTTVDISPGAEHYGEGKRNNQGEAHGAWTLYAKANNSVFAEGSYEQGKPVDDWLIKDTGGTKNAELEFSNGVLDGEYRLYYSSFTPKASGKLKTIGHIKSGSPIGNFIRYKPDSTVLVEYQVKESGEIIAIKGSQEIAKRQRAADQRLLNGIIDTIRLTPVKNP